MDLKCNRYVKKVGDCQVWEKYYSNLELNWSILVHNLKNCINVNVGDVGDVSKINIHFTNLVTNRLLSNRKPEIKEIIFLASSRTFSSSEHCLFVCSRVFNWPIAFVPRSIVSRDIVERGMNAIGQFRQAVLREVPDCLWFLRLWKLIVSQDLRNSK